MIDPARLEALGVVPTYHDHFGREHTLTPAAAEALLEAMDLPAGHWTAPPSDDDVVVSRADRPARLPVGGELELEGGSTRRVDGALPTDLPFGYHDLHRDDGVTTRVIASPGRCHLPDDLRVWGFAAQVYAARSRDSWGIGDLADLRRLGSWARGHGAGAMLICPIDAQTPVKPREASPYFPTSRRFRDPIYLRVEEVPGAAAVDLAGPAAFGRGLDERREIERDLVHDLKLSALWRIWTEVPRVREEPGFRRFVAEQGAELERFATFCVLAETYGTGWRRWPQRFRHPDGDAVAAFADQHADRVAFHTWLQWCCDDQLAAAGAAIPLMRDLPIGSDPDGADAWAWQDLLATGVKVGAPPDPLGPHGQDWKLPAFVPWKLRKAAYAPIVETLRSAFRHAGSLRIDHVLGLFRLFWIPPGGTPADGTYVWQPSEDLLAIVALESHRAGAYVVGEDLGTVIDGVRERLAAAAMLRYRVLWFEEDPPARWTVDALGSVTTHDLPTVAGLWWGDDLRMQQRLGLDPDERNYWSMRDRLSEVTGLAHDEPPEAAVVAAHRALAQAPSRVVVAQVEDGLAVRERINVPGTDDTQRANWSLALPTPIEDLDDHDVMPAVVEALRTGR